MRLTVVDFYSPALAMPCPTEYLTIKKCQKMWKEAQGSSYCFIINENGLLCRNVSLKGLLQGIVPEALPWAKVYSGHHLITARYPGTQRIYDSLRRQFYWPHIASDVYSYVGKFESCRSHKLSQKHQRREAVLPAKWAFGFVVIDTLGTLAKTRQENRFVVVTTCQNSKLIRAIPTDKLTTSVLATMLLEHWIVPFGFFDPVLSQDGPQLLSNTFLALCALLETRLVIKKHHRQSNGQKEKNDRILVKRLWHYIDKLRTSWDLFVQPITCGNNSQVHRTTRPFPFSINFFL